MLDTDRLTILDDPERLREVLAPVAIVDGTTSSEGMGEMPLPLTPGRRWGSPEMLARSDGLYVVTAGALTEMDLPIGRVRAIPVSYQTLPDRDDRWLAPGLGLVRRQYRHRGLDLLETWGLTGFTHEAVDNRALIALLESRLRLLLQGEGAWSRRSLLPADPVLRALLGPTALADQPEDDEGIRRLYLRSGGGLLTLERLPDGPGRAWLVTWSGHGRPPHRFAVPWETQPEGRPVGVRLDLKEIRRLAIEAGRLVGSSGTPNGTEASERMESAMQMLTERLSAVAPPLTSPRGSAEAWRRALGAAVGDSVLVTRYGSRLRINDDDFRVDLEIRPDAWAVTARLALPDGRSLGGAPRFIRGGAAPIVLSDPIEATGHLPVRRKASRAVT
ncbi:MAG: hypothetical protein FD129_1739, partial [bacterium]